jgi:hypothetical protein
MDFRQVNKSSLCSLKGEEKKKIVLLFMLLFYFLEMETRRSPSPVFNDIPIQRERPPREEPEKIRRWREEQQERLEKKGGWVGGFLCKE